MGIDETAITELRDEIGGSPHDPFLRCNLACSLAAAGRIESALIELAAAASWSNSPISAGCVAAAVRDVADAFARSWSLPVTGIQLRDVA